MDYKVVVTKDAEEDLERFFIKYLIIEKKEYAGGRKSTE